MPKKRTSTEEIVTKLREAEILLAKGQTVIEICRQMGVSEQTYYRWKNEYGGLKIDTRTLTIQTRFSILTLTQARGGEYF
jgi:putative transposase